MNLQVNCSATRPIEGKGLIKIVEKAFILADKTDAKYVPRDLPMIKTLRLVVSSPSTK